MNQIESLKVDRYSNDENFVLNECIDWFNKYLETYDDFRRLQKKRDDLQIVTTISKEKSKYLFSINLTNITTGQHMLEGPSISLDSKNKKVGQFLTAAITMSYITLNPDFHMNDLEGFYACLDHEFTKSTLNVTKIMEDDILSSIFTDILRLDCCAYNENKQEWMEGKLFSIYQVAREEQMKIDEEFCRSIDDSDQHYFAVKRYVQYQKRK